MKTYKLIIAFVINLLIFSNAATQQTNGRYVDLPGVKLWIVDSGGNGDPVILLHPRTGNSEFFQNTIPALTQAGYRAIAIDNPGWGKSMVNDPNNTTPVAQTLDALFDHLGFQQVNLVGTAMGGYEAVDYAAWKPDRLNTLVIAASGLGFQNDPEYDAFRKLAEIPGMSEQPSHIREVSPNYRASNQQGLAQWQVIYKNGQQDGVARPPLFAPNTPAKLASIKAHTLVIAGGIDLVTPSGAMRLWSRHIQSPKEFAVIPEAGHVLVWEQPDVFNQVLLDFLNKH